jgi:hypothetical protein
MLFTQVATIKKKTYIYKVQSSFYYSVGAMIMKKIFFGILIFLILFSNVNALVVEDIQQTIESGNKEVMKSNSDLVAQISALKNSVVDLQNDIEEMQKLQVVKSDLPQVYENINHLNRQSNINQLVSIIVVVIGAFAFGFLAKGKGWF